MANDLINLGLMATDAILGNNAAVSPEMLNTPLAPQTLQPQGAEEKLLPEPTISQSLLAAGMALLQADEAGYGVGTGLALSANNYQLLKKQQRDEYLKQRESQLSEMELMGRIRERQLNELQTTRTLEVTNRLKAQNPDLADLIDLDPKKAAEVIAQRKKGGGEGGPFGGTSMDAQTTNILLTGDPNSAEYLAAYNIAAQPKVQAGPDGSSVTITPDMSAFRVPAAIQARLGGTPGATATPQGPVGGVQYGDPQTAIVPGLTVVEGARPTTQDAKAVKDVRSAYEAIQPLMKERKTLIENAEDFSVGSEDAIKIQQNTDQILLKVKNLEETGALDAGSVAVIGPALGDPINRGVNDIMHPIASARKSITQMKVGADLAKEQLISGEKFLQNTLNGQIEARGYKLSTPLKSIFDETPDPAPVAAPTVAPIAPAMATDTPLIAPAPSAPAPAVGMLDDDFNTLTPAEIDALAAKHKISPAQVREKLGIAQ